MATAIQVESLWNGLTDNSGEPLAAGKVYTYNAGTTTPVSLYTSADQSTLATNPLILNGYGKAQVWADGRYKFVIKTSADVLISTLDNLLYGFDDSTLLWGGLSTGSASAQTVSVPATVTTYANGQRLSFIAGYSNTGATTMQLNSLAAVNITKGPSSVSLQSGDIVAGQLTNCTYYGGVFRLEEYPTGADVQRSRSQIASNVAGLNTITADLTPAINSYELGMVVRLKAVNTNNSIVTLNLNGLGPKAIWWRNQALVGGEIEANAWVELVYDGTVFQSLSIAGKATNRVHAATLGQMQDDTASYGGTSGGTANAQTLTLTPPITAYVTGMRVRFICGITNLAATTLNINGVGPVNIITRNSGISLSSNYLQIGQWNEVIYDGSAFVLLDDVSQIKAGNYDFINQSSGTANALVLTSTGPRLSSTGSYKVFMFATNLANTGATTVAIDGLAPISVLNQDNSQLRAGQLQGSKFYQLMLIAGVAILLNPSDIWQSWTPVLTQGVGVTYSIIENKYRLDSNSQVTCVFGLNVTSGGTAANAIVVGGLPISTAWTGNGVIGSALISVGSSIYTSVVIPSTTTELRFFSGSGTLGNNVGVTPAITLVTGSIVSGTVVYRI